MARHCILVIDDEELIRWSLRWHLERAGHEIIEAGNGEEARGWFRRGVDLVVLDLRLPDTDGIELIRELKKVCPGCPVIVMTAQGSSDEALEARRSGVFRILDKPFDYHQMVGLVDQALHAR